MRVWWVWRRSDRLVVRSPLAAFLLALATQACVRARSDQLPPLREGTRSMILAVDSGTRLDLLAIGRDTKTSSTVVLKDDAEVYLLAYARSLRELRLHSGELEPAGDEEPPLERPSAVFHKRFHPDRPQPWNEVALPSELAELRVKRRPPEECLRTDSCLDDQLCRSPCPDLLAPAPPASPAPPELPARACKDGFAARTTALGAQTCSPPPLAATCPEGQGQHYGSAQCLDIGSPCPPGDFPEIAPEGAVFVQVAAPAGGAGTRARPYASIARALQDAPSTIVLAKGTYAEPLQLPSQLHLIGACAKETRLTSVVSITAATGVVIEDVALTAAPYALIVDTPPCNAALRGVIARSPGAGIIALDGCSLDLEDAILAGGSDHGLQLHPGASAIAEGLLIDGGDPGGIWMNGATASFTRLLVRDTGAALAGACGLVLHSGAGATLDRAHFTRNRRGGACAHRSQLTATDLTITDTELNDGAIIADSDATVTVIGGALEGNENQHVVAGDRATISLTQVTMSALAPTGNSGHGLRISGAHLSLDHVSIEDVIGTAAGLYTSTASIAHLSVRGPERGVAFGESTVGLQILQSRASGHHLRLERPRHLGINVDQMSTAVFEDVSVREILHGDPQPPSNHKGADGIALAGESKLTIDRCLIEDAGATALSIEDVGTEARITNLEIRGAVLGGLDMRSGAYVDLDRARIEDAGSAAILVEQDRISDMKTTLILDDALITCTPSRGPVHETGLVSSGDTIVQVSKFAIRDASGAAIRVLLGDRGFSFTEGLIERSNTGILFFDTAASPYEAHQRIVFREVMKPVVIE